MTVYWEFRGKNKEEVHDLLKNFFKIDNRFDTINNDKNLNAFINGSHSDAFFHGTVSINSPFKFVSEVRDAFTIISCQRGILALESGNKQPVLSAGSTICISPNTSFGATSHQNMSAVLTCLKEERVAKICKSWFGTEFSAVPQLELKPFSKQLHSQWQHVISSIDLLHTSSDANEWILRSLEEYAVSLLICQNSNNFSKYLTFGSAASAKTVAAAEHFIKQAVEKVVTPAVVADFSKCSVIELEKGFREYLGISVRECIYAARITHTRNTLLRDGKTSYFDILTRNGFINSKRFVPAHVKRYGGPSTEVYQSLRSVSSLRKRAGGLSGDKVERLRQFVVTSLSRSVKVSELAVFVGMSTTQFRLAFKEVFGISPAQYILIERLNLAQRLLANTEMNISTIAAEAGFSSQSHLTTVMRKYLGTTPGEMRDHKLVI
ncbi:helix-turn-helix domain-containing protein [Ochrobactrum intermedium]|uniref:helix-turn-helix domain-containing protein n=1 Tax=Brucella intermedia TaxID=94625 RepID=UPI00128C6494|nr:helix-turn-helix domain-containing protein [Brucella intermedia]MPR64273.1 helix-turn-helix domain-containing protein [Brucella intermedia]